MIYYDTTKNNIFISSIEWKKKMLRKLSKSLTKQKAARKSNLAKGRGKRMETIKQKKEDTKNEEYDISSNDGDNDVDESSSDDDLIISRKKPTKIGKKR